MKKCYWFFALISLIFATSVYADSSPLPMLQSTSNQLIAALKQNQASLKGNPQVVYNIVNTILLPHVDTVGMARSVVGRQAWASATPAQQSQFVNQFTTLLVKTYSTALATYKSETVQFQPIRGGVNGNRAQVDSTIIRQAGAPSISVSYRLVLLGSQWKVYDFSVEGVSMLESYRSQFSSLLSQGGIVGLIQKLQQHNAST